MPSAPIDAQLANPRRGQIDRIGVRVLEELVEMIVTGAVAVGEFLPPEQALCDEFGVSRTVIRECIKRIQEKGLVVVAQGRGTQVRHFNDWNVLDPDVFDALVRHDESLGVLDEVSVVRAALEGVMAGEVASTGSPESLILIRGHLEDMRRLQDDNPAFLEADKDFHLATMSASRNRIAATIARSFFVRPRQSLRWEGEQPRRRRRAHAGGARAGVRRHGGGRPHRRARRHGGAHPRFVASTPSPRRRPPPPPVNQSRGKTSGMGSHARGCAPSTGT